MKYVDIHTHVNLDAFADDAVEVSERTLADGVSFINVGTGKATSEKAVALAHTFNEVFATVGVHPNEVLDEPFEYDFYKTLAEDEKVVALGECGLDFFRSDEHAFAKQREVFVAHIELANELQKPLMLHVRAGEGGDAYKEAFELIKAHAQVPGNVHFFAGSVEEGKRFWDIGYSTSFTGVITFTHDYDEVVRSAPKELLHAETDAPYVTPVPHRGERNEPAHVQAVYRKIAELRGVDEDAMRAQLVENAQTLFNI